MSENQGIEVPGEVKPQEAVETLAKEVFGWKPKEEFEAGGGNPEHWTPADEYIRKEKDIREGMKQALERERAEKTQVARTLESLKKHYMNVRQSVESEYKKEIETLRATKRALIKEGDIERAMLLDDQIESTKDEHAEKLAKIEQDQQVQFQQANPTGIDPAVQAELQADLSAWRKLNPWYTNPDTDINTRVADGLAQEWVVRNGGPAVLTQAGGMRAMLQYVSENMKKAKPELFEKSKGSAVDSGGERRSGGGSTPKFNEVQEKIYRDFVDMGVKGSDGKPITRAQLYDEWKRTGAI